ncbi:uncharacterized protein DS421_1g18440 [Arachis hypogaea]|nr:uncharacterized protein DS421_1g18440 [Arachis hypogaea]
MLGSSNQGSDSSSRARSHGGWVKNAHRDRGDRGGKILIQKDHSMDVLTIILLVRDGVAFLNGQMLKKKKP